MEGIFPQSSLPVGWGAVPGTVGASLTSLQSADGDADADGDATSASIREEDAPQLSLAFLHLA